MKLKFEWDNNKNAINKMKHGVSFEEAAIVFSDPKRYEMYDKIHSFMEKRWIVIGLAGWKILKVCFTEKEEIIRIFSARKATTTETKEYFYEYSTASN
jgi:uncharacterized DUF497 family protein